MLPFQAGEQREGGYGTSGDVLCLLRLGTLCVRQEYLHGASM